MDVTVQESSKQNICHRLSEWSSSWLATDWWCKAWNIYRDSLEHLQRNRLHAHALPLKACRLFGIYNTPLQHIKAGHTIVLWAPMLKDLRAGHTAWGNQWFVGIPAVRLSNMQNKARFLVQQQMSLRSNKQHSQKCQVKVIARMSKRKWWWAFHYLKNRFSISRVVTTGHGSVCRHSEHHVSILCSSTQMHWCTSQQSSAMV